MHCLGNDVVDLREPHNRRSAANPRFVERVLTPVEREAIGTPVPQHVPQHVQHRWLWACWSAKEAAYKALARHQPELPFIHRRFRVSVDTDNAGRLFSSDEGGTASGTVRYRATLLPVTWQWTKDWIHCLLGVGDCVYRVDSAADAGQRIASGTGMSHESSAVRALAARLLEQANLPNVRIERRPTAAGRPGAPLATRHGAAVPGCVISLSHDGRFVAAAVSVPDSGG